MMHVFYGLLFLLVTKLLKMRRLEQLRIYILCQKN